MDEKRFIEKYRDKELVLKTYQVGDLSTYNVFVDDIPLEGDEEELFWILLPQTKILFEDADTEIVKLVV